MYMYIHSDKLSLGANNGNQNHYSWMGGALSAGSQSQASQPAGRSRKSINRS